MKTLLTALSLACALVSAQAQDAEKKPNTQNNRMVACQKEAGDQKLEGAKRKEFVSQCLKNKPAPAPTQGQKLGACSKEAASKGLKGEERNTFLSECAKRP